jgi:WD40 repeat protein
MLKNTLLINLAVMATVLTTVTPTYAATFSFDQKLTAPDAAPNDSFGWLSVALSGTTALVGARLNDSGGTDSGSAYLFDTETGNLLHQLIAPDAAADDRLGRSVALSGTTALVGSHRDDDGGIDSGSAYLFDTATGSLLHKLTAPDAASNDLFGRSVALSGTTALVGSRRNDAGRTDSGSAYLFNTATGNLLHKFTAPDAASRFGWSVALSGTTALVGAWGDDAGGADSGSAYLFNTATGNLLHKLTAPDAASNDLFGRSVALNGTTALVGALGNDDGGLDSGSAYLFDTATGNLLHKLTAPDAELNDAFGFSVALSGTTALVGALGNDDGGIDSGSAYLFDTTSGSFLHKLTAPDALSGDVFGSSVALSGSTALVGASGDDDVGTNSGSAYLFSVEDIQPVPEPLSVFGLAVLGLGIATVKRDA